MAMTSTSDVLPDAPLTEAQLAEVAAAREKCRILYDGVVTPHRSCGIALAETFNRRTQAYQSLRRGGLTGDGHCGAIVAGRLILGEIFGDPDPAGPVTQDLVEAIHHFERVWHRRVDRGDARGTSIVCNTLTGQFPVFRSAERHAFCTDLATEVATAVAEVVVRRGVSLDIQPIAGRSTADLMLDE